MTSILMRMKIDKMPGECVSCQYHESVYASNFHGVKCILRPSDPYFASNTRPDWCPMFEAIGYITPNGDVVRWDYEESSIYITEE